MSSCVRDSVILDWQRSNTLAGGLVDGIGQRGNSRGYDWLANHAPDGMVTESPVRLHDRHFIRTQQSIVMEVTLDDTPFRYRDLAIQRRSQRKGDASLDLCRRTIRIDEESWIADHDNSIDRKLPFAIQG